MSKIREDSDITGIMIHHTKDPEFNKGTVVNNDYKSDGYFGSPYDIFINKDGRIDLTPRWIFATSADQYESDVAPITILDYKRHYNAAVGETEEMRKKMIHIGVSGDFDSYSLPPAQLNALLEVLKVVVKGLNIDPRKNLYFHREESLTTCPGKNFPTKESLIKVVKSYYPQEDLGDPPYPYPVTIEPAPPGTVYSEEATLYFDQLTTPPSSDILAEIATFIDDLNSDGIYEKIDEMWLFAMNTQSNALRGMKAYKDCTITGSVTFTAYQGFLGDGATGHLNTNYGVISDAINFSRYSASIGAYIRTEGQHAGYLMGVYRDASHFTQLLPRNISNQSFYAINTNGVQTVNSVTACTGLMGISRIQSDQHIRMIQNVATSVGSQFTTPNTTNIHMYILARSNNDTPVNFSNREVSFAWIGGGLNTSQMNTLATRVETLLDYLGAGVL